MIDTDKYEGHSRGNWSWGNKGSTDNGDGTIMIRPFTQLESKSGATLLAIHHGDAKQSDLKLIADAPLLLAEVMRLRGVIAQVWDLMQNSNHQDREAYFWGFDGKNTGWMKVHEELAMRELNWGEEE